MIKEVNNKFIFIVLLIIALTLVLNQNLYSGRAVKSTENKQVLDAENTLQKPSQQNLMLSPGGPIAQPYPVCVAPPKQGINLSVQGTLYIICSGVHNMDGSINVEAKDVKIICKDGAELRGNQSISDLVGIYIVKWGGEVEGCTIANYKKGIFGNSPNVNIKNNIIKNNSEGVMIGGNYQPGSSPFISYYGQNFTIVNNTIINNSNGIIVNHTQFNYNVEKGIISQNEISYNKEKGITVSNSEQWIEITNNNILRNKHGIKAEKSVHWLHSMYNNINLNLENGIFVGEDMGDPAVMWWDQSFIFLYKNNIMQNGKHGIFISANHYSNNHGAEITANKIINNAINGVYIKGWGDWAVVRCNIISQHNSFGILAEYNLSNFTNYTGNAYIYKNLIENNNYGIYLYDLFPYSVPSPGATTTVASNEIKNNQQGTIVIHGFNRAFYYNNFITNTQQAFDSGFNDYWDNGFYAPPPPPVVGNYWSDCPGCITYPIPGGSNVDNGPQPFPFYFPPDPTVLSGWSCPAPYLPGPPPICGDGMVNQWWEQCDCPNVANCTSCPDPNQICIPPGYPDECKCIDIPIPTGHSPGNETSL